MFIIPFAASKKEMKQQNRELKEYGKVFPKIFFYTDIIGVFTISLILSIFVPVMHIVSVSEFFGLMIGMQFQLLIPLILIALVVTIIKLKNFK